MTHLDNRIGEGTKMPKYIVTIASMSPVYTRMTVEAANADEAERIVEEMPSDDLPDTDEWAWEPFNLEKRDAYVVSVARSDDDD